MSVEQSRNCTGKGKPKHPDETLSQCHCVHLKSHMCCLLSNPGLRGENPDADRPSRGTAPTWLAQRITLILTVVFVGNDHLAVGRSPADPFRPYSSSRLQRPYSVP